MVPLYSGRFRSSHAKVKLKSEIVPEYSIPNNRVTSTRWKFCQREFQSDKNFPDEWTLKTEFGEPTEDDKKLLREIADDEMWIEGYFEIMFSPSRVCVYWDEYAGSKGAEKVIGYLRKLAND